MTITHDDELLLQRHLDGQLDAGAEAALRARLAAEPGLAARAAALRSLRELLRAARGPERRPSAGFTAGLLAEVRKLPARRELEQAELVHGGIVWCRRILLAAAVLFACGLAWRSGLLRHEAAGPMQADPAVVQREIERLEAALRAGRVPPPPASDVRPGK
jgi:anti-sigma factor RsiW